MTRIAATEGFVIHGDVNGDLTGFSVSSAGDVNGDGIDDLLVGAPGSDNGGSDAGGAYVIFGKAGGTRGDIELANLPATDGFKIQGDAPSDAAGFSVSAAGDINGDGIDDLIIGVPYGDAGGNYAGQAYVIFGKTGATRADIDLANMSAADGFFIQGDEAFDRAARSVSSAGDVNNDGIDDLIIGAPFGELGGSYAGHAYVIFGRSGETRAGIDLTSLSAVDGFVIAGGGAYDRAGFSVASAGDVNGDGIDDLIVGANRNSAGGNYAGGAYVIFGKVGATRGDIDLASLAPTDGFFIQNDNAEDQAGFGVSGIGDFNGDGFDDLLIGAPYNDDGGPYAGKAYVVFGKPGATRSDVDLASLTAADGFAIRGDNSQDLLGMDVSAAGDVNHDGFDDLIVGAPGGELGGNAAGQSYVIYGHASFGSAPLAVDDSLKATKNTAANYAAFQLLANDQSPYTLSIAVLGATGGTVALNGQVVTFTPTPGFTGIATFDYLVTDGANSDIGHVAVSVSEAVAAQTIDLTGLSAPQGFVIQGDAVADQAGYSVASAGDVNGDGFDDLIVGAPYGNLGGNDVGDAYVIFGKPGVTRSNIDLSSLAAADGFVIQGAASYDRTARSVASAGDINGDGIDDLIIGAPNNDNGGSNAGEAYVIFGKAGATRTSIDLTNLSNADGFRIQGDVAFDAAGRSVSSAGDLNGDGIDDLIVGARGGDNGGGQAGEAYVIWGKPGQTRADIDLTNLAATDGFTIQGAQSGDGLGSSVSPLGDINGDGVDDLIVAAPDSDGGGTSAGAAYVIFGRATPGRTDIDLASLQPFDGFIIQGDILDDRAGWSVSGAGDINGDGIDDLIVGAPYGDNGGSNAGEAYIIFGKAGDTRASIDLTNLGASDGFIIQGDLAGDGAGWSVSSAGDINGDGFDDLIVGAPYGDNGGADAGEAYVIFGKAGSTRANVDLTNLTTADGFIIQGDVAGDRAGYAVSSAGDVNGDGFDDLVVGAPYGDDGGNFAGEAYVIYGSAHIGGPPNQAPTGQDKTITILEDASYVFSPSDFGFSDSDGDSLVAVRITTAPSGGTIFYDADGAGGAAPAALTSGQSAPVADIDAGKLSYVPGPNQDGLGYASFTFQVQDDGGTVNNGEDLDQSPHTIVFNVTAVDDGPDAIADSKVTDEATIASGNVLANDTDADGGPKTVTAINGNALSVGQQISLPSGAKLTLNADGSYAYDPNGKFNSLTTAASGATNTSATDSFSYTVNGGDTASVTITINGLASAGDVLGGNSGANDITGTTGGDLFNLSQGGDDKAHGLGGNDGFYFGATMTGADEVDGGAGTLDQIGLQGNYLGGNALTLGANGAVGVEMMILLPGSNTAFGDTSGAFYSYDVTTVDANVGAGQTFVVNANTLRAGENLTFNGAAELDGTFLTYGGLGNDHLTGGQKVDGFFFGDGGRFGSGDTVDGQGQGVGQLDQLGLQGNYSGANAIAFGASQITNIEMIVLLSGTDTRFGGTGSNYSFDITMNDGNVASGQKMIINANTLVVAESVTFNGGAESNGYFQIFGGNGNDSYIGSQGNDDIWGGGGADTITGGLGADTLHGGAGDDIFRYTSTAHSTAVSMDSILDFATGDKVDVSAIDAIAGGADDAFSFVGAAAFTGTGTAELQAVNTGGNNWTVSADVDGNGSADLVIAMTVTDAHSLTGADFVL